MATKPYDELLKEEKIYHNVNDQAFHFFCKRGYTHSWKEANCFDMRVDLDDFDFPSGRRIYSILSK